MNNTPIIYLSHGGGPLPLLGEPNHQQLVETLQHLAGLIRTPKTIVMFSAHWETQDFEITAKPQPELLYDYFGFPDASYNIKYPLSGNESLSQKIAAKLKKSGLTVKLNNQRDFDHGVFVPLKIMFPEADIQCIQISLANSLSPELHFKLGESLRSIEEDVLFIGSGSSFHNLRHFMSPDPQTLEKNTAFHQWLDSAVSSQSYTSRKQQLTDWQSAPNARFCHPREEHLVPLFTCMGIAGERSAESFPVILYGLSLSCYFWR